MEERLNLIVEYGFLIMAGISSFACLARTDFNFAFALLCYYLWYSAHDDQKEQIGKKLILLNVVLLILDLIWLLTVGSSWSGNPNLQSYAGVHSFSLVLSWINWVVRIGILAALSIKFKHVVKDPKNLISGEIYDMNPVG